MLPRTVKEERWRSWRTRTTPSFLIIFIYTGSLTGFPAELANFTFVAIGPQTTNISLVWQAAKSSKHEAAFSFLSFFLFFFNYIYVVFIIHKRNSLLMKLESLSPKSYWNFMDFLLNFCHFPRARVKAVKAAESVKEASLNLFTLTMLKREEAPNWYISSSHFIKNEF